MVAQYTSVQALAIMTERGSTPLGPYGYAGEFLRNSILSRGEEAYMPVNYLRITAARRAGAFVKECRLASDLTQRELEERCGFTAGFIGKLERGEIKRIAIPDVYEIESKLKKFKRAGFESAGKTELEISSNTSIENNPDLQKSNSKSEPTRVTSQNISSGVYRNTEPIIEHLAVGKIESSNPATRPKQEPEHVSASTSKTWNLSLLSDVIWRIAIVVGVLYFLGNWLFGGKGNDADSYVPIPESTYVQVPAQIPVTSQFDEQGYDAQGFDQFGFDRSGRDVFGRDRNGYDTFGYDTFGYDTFGYDRNGYDRDGYDVFDYDTFGYNNNGYDRNGLDRFGNDRFGNDQFGCNQITRQNQFGSPC